MAECGGSIWNFRKIEEVVKQRRWYTKRKAISGEEKQKSGMDKEEAELKTKQIRKVAVSACLLGENCKYNGGNNKNETVLKFIKDKDVIPVCPEVAGGLPTPRVPVELVDGIAINREGVNVDKEFHLGVERMINKLSGEDIDLVILQPRSPSCGAKQIYDGTFTGTLKPGQGMFAKVLVEKGYKVVEPDELDNY